MNKSNIDYLAQAESAIGRPGYTLNIVTGCKHGCEYCYARRMVEHGRLKGHSSYPYGFEPTFHPERVKAIGGKPKLIFLNDMGDVGGDWKWRYVHPNYNVQSTPKGIANEMENFALLNPQHIILLLTKNPSWYRYAEWPENCFLGFSASNNEELERRGKELFRSTKVALSNVWISLEPWMDNERPDVDWLSADWLVIGGLSGPKAQPVSVATRKWLYDKSIKARRFTKCNVGWAGGEGCPREYPEGWRVDG